MNGMVRMEIEYLRRILNCREFRYMPTVVCVILAEWPLLYLSVHCCHNQPKVGNDFFELISSSDAAEKELSSKSKIVFL